MLRIVLGVIGGFISWLIVWIGTEKVIAAVWPEGFGVHQRAFEEALTKGGTGFAPTTTFLLTQIVMGAVVSLVSGVVSAMISGENTRAPMYLGFALLALGMLKAVMSWQLVPVWYHILFTVILFPMAILGGKLISAN